jgi:hypothetical protein
MVRPTYALNQAVVGPCEGVDQDRFNCILCSLVANNASLRFYILREAEWTKRNGSDDLKGSGHYLGRAGERIVAEVLVGLTCYDEYSFL